LFLFLPYGCRARDERLPQARLPQARLPQARLPQARLPQARLPQARLPQARRAIVDGEVHRRKVLGKRNMNTAGQIAVTLAALIGFGRLFLADESESHRLSGVLILASLVGKVALSI
jgi:hypothetical protein